MEQRGRNSDVVYLPEVIIRNILQRLPVKSLIRFQCVCKLWKNLIKDPPFIADHLQRYSHQNPYLLFECDESNDPPGGGCLRLLDCMLQVREIQKTPLSDSLEDGCAEIITSCNGLLLINIFQYCKSPPSLSLWNPSTTEVRHVPSGTITHCFDPFSEGETGFGFSPIVNDYKIVRTYSDKFDDVGNQAEVFSLSRGSWKGIDTGNLKRVRLDKQTVTANGAIFWSGIKRGCAEEEGEDEDVNVILSFDIANEVFTVIPMLGLQLHYDVDAIPVLTVYENKLAILFDVEVYVDGAPNFIGLWVLDEGTCASGETWSLIKRFTSSPLPCIADSGAIWRNEIVCKAKPPNERGRPVLYTMNLTTNEVKRFVIPYGGSVLSIYNYVESLVSVGNNYIEES